MSKVGDTSIQPTTALAGTLAVPSPHASLNGLLFVGTDIPLSLKSPNNHQGTGHTLLNRGRESYSTSGGSSFV